MTYRILEHLGYAVIGVITISIAKNLFFVIKGAISDYKKKRAEKKAAKEETKEEKKVDSRN